MFFILISKLMTTSLHKTLIRKKSLSLYSIKVVAVARMVCYKFPALARTTNNNNKFLKV